MTDLEQSLLTKLMRAHQRLRDHDRLVSSLVAEVAKLQRDKDEAWERLRGDLEIRRIAALNGIPQKEVIAAFQTWMLSPDFDINLKKWRRR